MTEAKASDGITLMNDLDSKQAATANADCEPRPVEEEELSEEWLAIVDEAMDDLRAGRFIPYEEMKRELDL